jgi:hypothetical protein
MKGKMKGKTSRTGVFAAAIVAALLLATPMLLLIAPVLAVPALTLTPNRGPPNTTIIVSGSGFTPGETVEIWFDRTGEGMVDRTDDTQLGADVIVGADGTFSVERVIPSDASPGITHIMVIADGASGVPMASALFTVTTPSIILNPSSGPPGSMVSVSGSGYAPGIQYKVVFDAAGTPVDVAAFTPTATGDIPPGLTFIVPDRTAGSKTVEVREVISNNLIVSTTFTVTSTIYVTPPSGPAGLTVSVSVRGLPSGVSFVDIYLDLDGDVKVDAVAGGDEILATSVSVTTNGRADTTVNIPSGLSPGSYAIMAITAGASGTNLDPLATGTFTVIPPSISLPVISRGPVGAKFRITGQGFTPNTDFDIYFDIDATGSVTPADVKIADVTTNSFGEFTTAPTDVTVPLTAPAGPRKVLVVPDGATGPVLASADFLVTVPQITLSPSTGPIGTTVTVTGTGFTPHSTVPGFGITVQIRVDRNRDGDFDDPGEVITTTPSVIHPDATGGFTATFTFPDPDATVPDATGLPYAVRAIETVNTNARDDEAFFVPKATITLTPSFGLPGDTITVSGTNFKISSTVRICIDKDLDGVHCEAGEILVPSVSTDSLGAFPATTFTIPSLLPGTYTVRVVDTGLSNVFADRPLSVATPETLAILSLLSTINTEVLNIEAKLDPGGAFYTFVNNWFTFIDNKLGTFGPGESVKSLLDEIKTTLGTFGPGESVKGLLVAIDAKLGTFGPGESVKGLLDEIKTTLGTFGPGESVKGLLVAIDAKLGTFGPGETVKGLLGTFNPGESVASLLYQIRTAVTALETAVTALDLTPVRAGDVVSSKAGTNIAVTSASPYVIGGFPANKAFRGTLTIEIDTTLGSGVFLAVEVWDGDSWARVWRSASNAPAGTAVSIDIAGLTDGTGNAVRIVTNAATPRQFDYVFVYHIDLG